MEKFIEVKIPYGEKIETIRLPEEKCLGVFTPDKLKEITDYKSEARAEIRKGIQNSEIVSLASPEAKVAIAVTDRTRVTPNKLFVETLIEELISIGITEKNITVIVGTGMHSPDTSKDIINNLGKSVAERVHVVNNAPMDKSLYNYLGDTSYGTPVEIHKAFAQADIKIATGNIVPCLMAGWTGGGKTVVPGVASRETIYANHRMSMDQLEKSNRGSLLGVLPPVNIVRDDIEEAADIAELHMVVNSVLNYDGTLVKVLAGNSREVHRQGLKTFLRGLGAAFPKKADIVLAGIGSIGFEVSLYQGGSRVLQSLDEVLNVGGTIIFSCECREGIYEGILKDIYTDWMQKMPTPEEIRDLTRSKEMPPEDGVVLYVFSWIIHKLKAKIIVVTEGLSAEELRSIHMEHSPSLQEALDKSLMDYNERANVAVLPYATMMMPQLKK